MMARLLTATVLGSLLTGSVVAQIPGSYVSSGEGCPDDSLLYELFAPGGFDLSTQEVAWFPNSGLGYIVVSGPGTLLPTAGGFNLGAGDDDVVPTPMLNFPFPYPTGNGSTSSIDVASNGYIYLESGTIVDTRPNIDLQEFRDETPSLAVFGNDWDLSAGGTVWFNQSATVAWVTWDNVFESGGASTHTFQVQLHADGRIVFAYASQTAPTLSALVGWSGGGGREDDGSVDLSAAPIVMGAASGPLTISAPPGRLPTTGLPFDIDIDNVPTDAVAGSLLLGAFPLQVDLDLIGMLGCDLLTAADIGAVPTVLTPPTGILSLPLPTTPGTVGLVIETQLAVIAPSVNTFGVATSNLGTMTIGDTQPVIVRASGADNFNADETQGFWRVINASPLPIQSMRLSWVGSSIPNINYFDTAQTGMANRFDAGNSTIPSCYGTYRNDSDAVVGLVYTTTPTTPCGGISRRGWIGSVLGLNAGQYRIIDFSFNSFDPGEVFEFDADTDPGLGNGGAMAGLVVTVTMQDGSTRSGELIMVNANTAEVLLLCRLRKPSP